MDIRVLGRLEVHEAGRAIEIRRPMERALLTLLAAESDKVVSTERLIDGLWGESPPATATKTLQTYVHHLRSRLPEGVIATDGAGYRLTIDPMDVDAHRFLADVAEARTILTDDPQAAGDLLTAALASWHGTPFADAAEAESLRPLRTRLEDLRLRAIADRIEAGIRCGRHEDVLAELPSLLEEHPLREDLWALYMLALYRGGRQAEALRAFSRARHLLVEDLGIEPGPELQSLQDRMLAQDPTLLMESAPVVATDSEGASAREEERKLVVLVFADLTGYTMLGEQLDPERLRALLADYYGEMTSVVESWGGTVDQFVGDAVVAVFGIPAVHEDDAERALMAALDMRARLEELNPRLAAGYGVELGMRIGVNSGVVVAGGEGYRSGLAGDAVNVAARLRQTAEPGQILVGERTYLSARRSFHFEALEERLLKGKATPVRAWRLLGTAQQPRSVGIADLATRLVGRRWELGLLESVYRAAIDEARPRLVTILGEPGVGKTRLVAEFVTRLQAGDLAPAAFGGRCLPYGRGLTYFALRELLWSAAGILLDDSSAVAGEKLEKLVREALGTDSSEADRVLFALAKTAGIAFAGNPLDGISPESIGEELGLAWPRFVSALASQGPLLLEIEDLHWAESPLLDMLEHMVSRSTGPVLIVATARSEFAESRPGWSGRAGMSQVGLETLPEADLRALLEELLPMVSSSLRERVLAAAEGNPFFAEEIVRHLLDQGFIEQREEGLVEADAETPVAIPDTVRALLAARVDALLPDQKRTLQDAAVVGRGFWTAPLEAMRPGVQVREALQGLEAKGLVVTRPNSSLPRQIELSFRHGLIREVAYESIPKARRANAHAAVGRWIEDLAGERREEFIELIAHHYESAASPEYADLAWPEHSPVRQEVCSKAVVALLEAGGGATARYSIDQAFGFANRVLALAATDGERLSAVELKALAAHAGVRADEAWTWYEEALELAERIGDPQAMMRLRAQATLLWSRYRGAFSGGDWQTAAVKIVEQGLRDAGTETATFEVGALLVGRASLTMWELVAGNRLEALRDAEQAVEIAEDINSPILLSYGLDACEFLLKQEGFCQSAELAERTLGASRSMDDRVQAHEMLVTAAIAFSDAGRFEAAAEVATEAACQAAGLSSHHRLHAASAQAHCLLPAGRIQELCEATSRVTDLVAEEGMRTCFHGIMALAGGAFSLHETGDGLGAGRVLEVFDAAQPTTASAETDYRVLEVLRSLWGLEESRGRLERVKGSKTVASEVARMRAELQVAALSGDWDRLHALLAEARALSVTACAPHLMWIADWAEAVRLASAGHSPEAVPKAMTAAGRLERFGDRYTAARLLVDLLPFLDTDVARSIASHAAPRLLQMGASTSAAQAWSWIDGDRS